MSEEIEHEPEAGEICVKATINYGTGVYQRIHFHVSFTENTGESFLQLSDTFGRVSGLLADNQHLQLVERDEP